ncbi:hypothetical protein JYT84_00285 [bacterium AH-315-M10]|nr:hypothetical protein [bacterium AH-315-M10]
MVRTGIWARCHNLRYSTMLPLVTILVVVLGISPLANAQKGKAAAAKAVKKAGAEATKRADKTANTAIRNGEDPKTVNAKRRFTKERIRRETKRLLDQADTFNLLGPSGPIFAANLAQLAASGGTLNSILVTQTSLAIAKRAGGKFQLKTVFKIETTAPGITYRLEIDIAYFSGRVALGPVGHILTLVISFKTMTSATNTTLVSMTHVVKQHPPKARSFSATISLKASDSAGDSDSEFETRTAVIK